MHLRKNWQRGLKMNLQKFKVYADALFGAVVFFVLMYLGSMYLIYQVIESYGRLLPTSVVEAIYRNLDFLPILSATSDSTDFKMKSQLSWLVIISLPNLYATYLTTKKVYRFLLKSEIESETCKNCGVPYQISSSKQDFVTTAVPRSTVKKRGLDSNGNPVSTHLVSWTEEIGHSIITTQCNACGAASTRRKNFNRKVNKRSDLQF
jgi:hypothetical protein